MSAANLSPHRVCIAGASGRMGQMLIDAVRATDDCVLSGALDIPASPAIGRDAGAYGGQATGVAQSSNTGAGSPSAGWVGRLRAKGRRMAAPHRNL